MSLNYDATMREHIAKCVQLGKMEPFATKSVRARLPRIIKSRLLKIVCICRGIIEKGCVIIQCDNCKEWFHGECVAVTKIPKKDWFL